MKGRYFVFIILVFLLTLFIPMVSFAQESGSVHDSSCNAEELYVNCGLDGKLDYEIFLNALESLEELEFINENLVTIIDYSLPSTEKRFYVIDLKNQKLLYYTLVAHGKNSGLNIASDFSNKSQSLKTSLGLYMTAESYQGKHGYSLKLDGLEKGYNDNARNRAIVIHGAKYVSSGFIAAHGRLGRSWGCPALPPDLSNEIIDLIKGGSCLYIFAKDEEYLENSLLAD